ncbi:hypothetical protein ACQJBY_018261 [Aegilops geniculata]
MEALQFFCCKRQLKSFHRRPDMLEPGGNGEVWQAATDSDAQNLGCKPSRCFRIQMTNVLGCNLEMVDKQFDSGQRSMSESEKDRVGGLKSLEKKEESNAWLTQPKPSRPDCSMLSLVSV